MAVASSGKRVVRQDAVMWMDRHVEAARRLVPNSRYRRVAAKMAMTDYRALDYLKLAPALLIGACRGRDIKGGYHISQIASPFGDRIKSGIKLRNLLNEYGVAPQFRALHGGVITPAAEGVVLAISGHADINPSCLAQAIPEEGQAQTAWIRAIHSWMGHVDGRRPALVSSTLPWAVANIRPNSREPFDATVVGDYWIAHEGSFDQKWTATQAHARARTWHREMAEENRRHNLARYTARIGATPYSMDLVTDYSPYPTGMIVSDMLFQALDTPRLLSEESATMHHCVRAYASDVIRGRSRIYSVLDGDKRVATLELTGFDGRRDIAQIKGACNANPPDKVWKAARLFADYANRQARAAARKAA